MAFKLFVLASVLAYANAGGLLAPAVATYSAAPAVSSSYIHSAAPAVAVAHTPIVQSYAAAPVVQSYASAPVAIHAPAVGASQQNVYRSLGGAQSVSTYSKAVDSAFSTVRKYDTRITNDGLAVAPVAAYAAQAYHAYSAPLVTKTYAAAPAYSTYAAAPAYSTYAHGPAYSTYAAAPAYSTYAAAPAYSTYAAPLVAKSVAPGPLVTKAALAYSPAAVVAHTTFTGLGASYAW